MDPDTRTQQTIDRIVNAATEIPAGGQLIDNELFLLITLLGSFVALIGLALAVMRVTERMERERAEWELRMAERRAALDAVAGETR